MRVSAVVFAEASGWPKRRLSSGFSSKERKLLSAAMLEDVLVALKSSVVCEAVVVGTDSNVRQVVDRCGVSFISERRAGLASGIRKAIKWCIGRKADAVLVLPINIPLVSSRDIYGIVELGSQEPSMVLSPSLDGGMSALFLNPPNVIRTCFGPKCFFKNVEAAIKNDVTVRFYSSRDIATKVDSQEDLQRLLETENFTINKDVFQQIASQKKDKYNDRLKSSA